MKKIASSTLKSIFESFPEIIAVYLFGSYLEEPAQAQDVDVAVLLAQRKGIVDLYTRLHPRLEEIFAPLEVDLLFLNLISVPMTFEVISKGKVIYCVDDERRTDFEYLVSGLYMDYQYHLRQAQRELYEAIKEASGVVQ
ncbi:MAG: type VII toxin-antitoxin system MntA family adenylyltransferase antitoxin [Moorellaceae bacterium]